jgi:hypothetical protein
MQPSKRSSTSKTLNWPTTKVISLSMKKPKMKSWGIKNRPRPTKMTRLPLFKSLSTSSGTTLNVPHSSSPESRLLKRLTWLLISYKTLHASSCSPILRRSRHRWCVLTKLISATPLANQFSRKSTSTSISRPESLWSVLTVLVNRPW